MSSPPPPTTTGFAFEGKVDVGDFPLVGEFEEAITGGFPLEADVGEAALTACFAGKGVTKTGVGAAQRPQHAGIDLDEPTLAEEVALELDEDGDFVAVVREANGLDLLPMAGGA